MPNCQEYWKIVKSRKFDESAADSLRDGDHSSAQGEFRDSLRRYYEARKNFAARLETTSDQLLGWISVLESVIAMVGSKMLPRP